MSEARTEFSVESAGSYAATQGYGYRRGFVLGLTLAEAALLLIFVILLLLVVGFERRDRVINSLRKLETTMAAITPEGVDPVEHIELQLSQMAQLREVARVAGHEWDDDFIELVRAVAATPQEAGLVDIKRALEDRQIKMENMMEVAAGIAGAPDIERLVERMVDQEAALRNQRGQVVNLREQLARTGLSGVLPSCWTTPEGKIDYLLDVVLDSRGIRVRESFPERRSAERKRLPLPHMDSGRVYSQNDFRASTQGLFNWSVTNECRFYVTIFDATAAHEKNRYKELLETVEGHFYKRLARNASPF